MGDISHHEYNNRLPQVVEIGETALRSHPIKNEVWVKKMQRFPIRKPLHFYDDRIRGQMV